MKLIQQLEATRNLKQATSTTIKGVVFPSGIEPYLESLRLERLIKRNTPRKQSSEGHQWANDLSVGGIVVETSDHPSINKTGLNVTVTGSDSNVQRAMELLSAHVHIFNESIEPEQVTVAHQYHDELNPDLWDGKELKPEIKDALVEIADAFVDTLKMNDLTIEDVVVTGSNANYNWTDVSDIDIHIIVDMSSAKEQYGEIVPEYFEAKKRLWNLQHDIKVRGYDLEVYVEDSEESHTSTGVFSLTDNTWIVEPEHNEPTVDTETVRIKAAEFINEIDDIASTCNKASVVEDLMERIKKMRKAGLTKGGEFSVENLTFKVLRNEGYLEKLSTCKTRVFDRELSVEEEEWNWD